MMISTVYRKHLIPLLTIILCLMLSYPLSAQGKNRDNTVRVRLFSVNDTGYITLYSPGMTVESAGGRVESSQLNISSLNRPDGSLLVRSPEKQVETKSQIRVVSQTPVTIVNGNGVEKTVLTPLFIKNTGERLIIIQETTMEDYIAGVVLGEMPTAPMEALKAQAVAARSFAAAHPERHGKEGYDFCDSTHCQFYRGFAPKSSMHYIAARETSGISLKYNGKPFPAYYHAVCGGHTSSAGEVFGYPVPGSVGILDKFDPGGQPVCRFSPHYMWIYETSPGKLTTLLSKEPNISDISPIKDITVIEEDSAGRAKTVEIKGHSGTVKMHGYDFWQMMGEHLGWGKFKSSFFMITREKNKIEFYGRGLGHGIGLCQEGSKELAEMGWGYKEILSHYYPECEVGY